MTNDEFETFPNKAIKIQIKGFIWWCKKISHIKAFLNFLKKNFVHCLPKRSIYINISTFTSVLPASSVVVCHRLVPSRPDFRISSRK